jgi:hypothetical protein
VRILVLLIIVLIFLPCVSIGADTGISSIDTIFLPKKYYVGDKVELRIKLTIEEGYILQLPENIPESSWMNFHSIEITKIDKNSELRIVFTSFIPGTRSLPSLNLGGVVLNSVKLHTSSLIDSTGNDFVGIADQLLLPGTKLILVLVVGTLFLGPLLVLMLLGPLRKKITNFVKIGRGRRPIKRLNKILRELEDQKGRISCRRFYIRLSKEVREYLSKRSDIDFITLTTLDMSLALNKVVNTEFAVDISEMMKLADSIKFGRLTTNDTRKISDIILIRNVSSFIEKKIKDSTATRGSV